MTDNQQIQEDLRNLSKHSLNKEQKQRIILRLTSEESSIDRKLFIKPIFAVIFSFAVLSILVMTQYYGKDERNLTADQQEHEGIDFVAKEGENFVLADTKQEVIGIKGKVALLNTFQHFVAEDKRRVAKLMTFFWGDPAELVGKTYRVDAISTNNEEITLSEGKLGSALNSENAHVLHQYKPFPSEGKWKLSFYVEENLYEEFTLDVLPPFPKTKHYILMESPLEMNIDKESSINIESSWKDKKEIGVKLFDEKGKVVDQAIFKQDAMNYDASTGAEIYIFNGKLDFSKQEKWTLEIDGELTQSFSN
ncbi:hypothetical protein [Paenisporosarcina quisquiliarum]|uniref:hypothetical protein n=1 Tax=Paenisporosarcina quisquiliarum TaxID=365346 RepID=UPI003735749E